MVNILRRFQKPLMIAVTILVIVSFVWLYNHTDFEKAGDGTVATIYDRKVSLAEARRVSRLFEVAQQMGMFEFLQSLMGAQRASEDFIWNLIILREEAKRLGITVTTEEVVEHIKKIPFMQTNGQFDPSKYAMIVEKVLGPNGFTPDTLEELARAELTLERIKTLLGSTTQPLEAELRSAYEKGSQKIELSYVRLLKAEVESGIKVTDEDAKKFFEERKDTLRTPEKRKVIAGTWKVKAPESPEEPTTGPKERMEKMQKLAEQAADAHAAITEQGMKLEEAVQKFGGEIVQTEPFAQEEAPAEIGSSPDAAQAAFRLTKEAPVSDIVTTPNGYYLLQLAEVVEPRPQTFEEAKAELTAQLMNERVNEAMSLKATEVRNKIDAELKGGKSFTDAATAAGVKAEKYPTFSLREPPRTAPDVQIVTRSASELAKGELSQPVEAPTGTLLMYVENRLPIEDADFQKARPDLLTSVSRFNSEGLFNEWLRVRRKEAKVTVAKS